MKRLPSIFLSITLLSLVISACASDETATRKWISHRGVDLNHTIAGENSLEAVAYARMVGFDCIETDVRTTSDEILVCMHDETINRTCLNKDGSEIQEKTRVCDLTFDELRSGYKLKADREDMRSQVPTLEEYLTCCKENGLLVFIEPKLKDPTGENYLRIMEIADRIFGRDGYIITSNNFANDVIRNTLGISDVKVMTILYQTTYEAVQALGNSVMAISSSRFNKEDFAKNMEKAVNDGFETESNTDNFPRMDMINKSHVDYISTDLLLPDYKGLGDLAYDLRSPSK